MDIFGMQALWVVGLALGIACLVCLIASIASEHFKRLFKFSDFIAGKLGIVLVGTFFMVFPIVFFDRSVSHAFVWGALSEAIPAAIYETAQVLVLQVTLDSWSLAVFQFIGDGLWGHIYFWLMIFYAIACPVALAMTAIDAVVNGLAGFAVWLQSLKKAFGKLPIYVFYGLDDNTVTLALDLLDHVEEGRMPLLIFTNVDSAGDDSGESFAAQVREAASGIADLVVTPMVLEDVPDHLCRRAKRDCTVNYLVISNNSAKNVRATIRLTDIFTRELIATELERLDWDDTKVGSDPVVSDQTRSLARNIHVWCTHDSPDDDLIFDSLPHRGPSEQIMAKILREHENRHDSRSRSAISRRLLPLEEKVRSLFEVRLISETRDVVWDVLVEHPLTEVLDPIDLSQSAPERQLLYVVVLGLTPVGFEAIKGAFWFGRLPGVELRILGVGSGAKEALRVLGAQAPALLSERRPTSTERGDDLPTVRLVEASTDSIDMERLLMGDYLEGYSLNGNLVDAEDCRIPDEARIYCLACLEDDDANLDVSLRIQRALAERALQGRLSDAEGRGPVIALLLEDEELYDSVGHLADGTERFPIVPFGATYHTFSYESILAAPWEKAALNLQAAHDSAFMIGRGDQRRVTLSEATESYNSLEVRKLSNRAAVRFAIYRLWCMGLDHGMGTDEDLHERWLAKLGAVGALEGALAGDPDAFECVCGLQYERLGMDAAEREARVGQVMTVFDDVRRRWPVLAELAANEHERWCAFFRAEGWESIPDFDELRRTIMAVGRAIDPLWPYPHQSSRLKRHYYLVDDPAEEARRGAECRDDPCADDRLIVLETIRTLRGDIVG